MTIDEQLRNYEMSREAGSAASMRERVQAQVEFDSNPLRWQIPRDEIPLEVMETPGGGHYVNHPGITYLVSPELEATYVNPAKEMWLLMEAAHECWVKDSDPRALVVSWVEGIDPQAPQTRWWAHEEEGFLPMEMMSLKWLAQELPTYTDTQWKHLVVVWTKVKALSDEVAEFLASTRGMSAHEERLQWWIGAVLQVMIDRKMPQQTGPPQT